jgi:DNA-damage-inducible protein J
MTMAKSATVRARVEPALKEEADAILQELGLSASDLISMTLKQLVMRKGIPFDVRIPNAETIEAITEPVKGLKRYASSDDMMSDILTESDN